MRKFPPSTSSLVLFRLAIKKEQRLSLSPQKCERDRNLKAEIESSEQIYKAERVDLFSGVALFDER